MARMSLNCTSSVTSACAFARRHIEFNPLLVYGVPTLRRRRQGNRRWLIARRLTRRRPRSRPVSSAELDKLDKLDKLGALRKDQQS